MSDPQPGRIKASRLWVFLSFGLVVLLLMLTYGRHVENEAGGDEHLMLEYVDTYGPLGGFLGIGRAQEQVRGYLFRPGFSLQTWVYSNILGHNRAMWRGINLLMHIMGVATIYALVRHFSRHIEFATVSTLLYGTHWYVKPLVIGYNLDSMMYTTLIVLLSFVLVLRWQHLDIWRSAILFGVLMLAPLTRENGLAAPMALAGYALLGLWRKSVDRKLALTQFAIATLAVIAYLLLRIGSVGLDVAFGIGESNQVNEEAGYLFAVIWDMDSLTTAKRFQVYLYSISANLVGSFFPFFDRRGTIMINVLLLSMMLIVVAGFVIVMAVKWPDWSRRVRLLAVIVGTLGVIAIVAFSFVFAVRATLTPQHVEYFFQIAPYSLGMLMTLAGLWLAVRLNVWQTIDRQMVVLFVLFVIACSIIPFAYFRFRNLRFNLIGYLFLFALVVSQYQPRQRVNQVIYATLLIGFVSISVFNLRSIWLGRMMGV